MSNNSVLNTTIPENSSILQSTKYTLLFPTMPFLRYFSQTATIPSVSTSGIAVSTPFSDTFRHGTTLRFEDFTINAIVDEDLRVWEETYNWIKSLTRPSDFNQYARYRNAENMLYHDAILTVNTNANNPNIRFKFFNCHPTSIGAIAFNTADTADSIPTVDITIRYDYYEIERL
jgi:hypothetical protein